MKDVYYKNQQQQQQNSKNIMASFAFLIAIAF